MVFEQGNFAMDIRIFWLALGTFALSVESFALPALLPDISAATGVSLIEGGYLILTYALAYAIGAPILAALTGARDRRVVLTAAAAVYALATLAAGFAASYGLLMGARIVMALGIGLYSATAQATGVAMSEPHHRARAIAVIVGGTTLAVAFGSPLGGLLANAVGWRGMYFAIAATALLAAGAIWLMVPGGMRGTRVPLRQRLAVVAQPGVAPVLASMLLFSTGGFTLLSYIAPLATGPIGLDRSLLPGVMLAFGVGAAIGNYAGGQLADRLGAPRTALAATLLSGIVMLVISALPLLGTGIAGPVFIGLVVLWGIAGWAFPPATASRLVKLAPDSAPLALSLNWSALYFGVAAGAAIGGQVLAYAGPVDLGLIGAIFPLVAAAVIWATDPARDRLPAGVRLG
jgi:predicted MFS family arabinose efflux permease